MGGLANYFIRRVLLMIPTFFGISLIYFVILQIVPGGLTQERAAVSSPGMDPADTRQETRAKILQLALG